MWNEAGVAKILTLVDVLASPKATDEMDDVAREWTMPVSEWSDFSSRSEAIVSPGRDLIHFGMDTGGNFPPPKVCPRQQSFYSYYCNSSVLQSELEI